MSIRLLSIRSNAIRAHTWIICAPIATLSFISRRFECRQNVDLRSRATDYVVINERTYVFSHMKRASKWLDRNELVRRAWNRTFDCVCPTDEDNQSRLALCLLRLAQLLESNKRNDTYKTQIFWCDEKEWKGARERDEKSSFNSISKFTHKRKLFTLGNFEWMKRKRVTNDFWFKLFNSSCVVRSFLSLLFRFPFEQKLKIRKKLNWFSIFSIQNAINKLIRSYWRAKPSRQSDENEMKKRNNQMNYRADSIESKKMNRLNDW